MLLLLPVNSLPFPAVTHLELGADRGPPALGAGLQRVLFASAQHVFKQVVDKVQPDQQRETLRTYAGERRVRNKAANRPGPGTGRIPTTVPRVHGLELTLVKVIVTPASLTCVLTYFKFMDSVRPIHMLLFLCLPSTNAPNEVKKLFSHFCLLSVPQSQNELTRTFP